MSLGFLSLKGYLLPQLQAALFELRVGEANRHRRVHGRAHDLMFELLVAFDAELCAVPLVGKAQ
jgi:hypothetical protein